MFGIMGNGKNHNQTILNRWCLNIFLTLSRSGFKLSFSVCRKKSDCIACASFQVSKTDCVLNSPKKYSLIETFSEF
jgi:hypothetical protein